MATQTRNAHGLLRALIKGAAFIILCGLALAAMAVFERNARLADLTAESERLHAVASQRADQHDAHLTALSAIAVAGVEQRPDLFREVAGAIMEFYPRIIGVSLVPLDENGVSLEIGVSESGLDDLIRAAAHNSTGMPAIVRYPTERPAYLIVKRSPNSADARYGLALIIDALALLDGDSPYWMQSEIARWLSLPDSTPLVTSNDPINTPQFARALSSGTQPLELKTALRMSLTDLLPPARVALVLVLIAILAWAIRAIARQRAKVRAAEARAEFSGLETRLSHALRVNALGEMASGMAHELTQPLTAILAQTQAARHIATRGDLERVTSILDDVVGQTRRASAILERLRNWTRPRETKPENIDLRDCIHVAETLLAPQATQIGAHLSVTVPPSPIIISGDRIELEQTLFNLMRNALDAVAENPRTKKVIVHAFPEGDMVTIEIRDNGHGIPPNLREQLFTPFVTTREHGTGLGLALSQRLVERAGGSINVVDVDKGACFQISLPLALPGEENAE